jgi:Chs5-Arf1p-binding protein BUD7/BCH1
LLTEIAASIGWDQLLRTRSQVFVMEEEYRSERQHMATPKVPSSRNASTVALSGTPNGENEATNGTSKTAEQDSEDAEGSEHNDDSTKGGSSQDPQPNGVPENSMVAAEKSMEKPLPTIASEEVKSGSDEPDPSRSSYTHFQHKRLCERWLDNLFMVLYEDLRIYTIWRTEMAQYRQQQLAYKKSAAEWEILGELAERLHHSSEAIEAYQQCLNIRFSPKAMKGLLKMFEKDGDKRAMLGCLIRLITWQYRWYSEVSVLLQDFFLRLTICF